MSDYKIDSLAIQEKSQSIALEKFGEIESNCQLSPVAFVKENHTFKKIRERLTEPHFGVTLGVMMAKVCAYAGIKNEITDHDKFDIGRAIKNRFSDLSCEEFMKAFLTHSFNPHSYKWNIHCSDMQQTLDTLENRLEGLTYPIN